MKIYNFDQIKKAIDINKDLDSLVNNQRQTFIDFSKNLYEIPLPIQLSFSDYQSDCHIKAGFKKGGDIFIIKSATGFYNNPAISLPSNDGAILVFSQKTGLLQTILHEKSWLTTLRTAIATLVAASITPWVIQNIGIIGTGILAKLTFALLKKKYPKANIYIWGRNLSKATAIASKKNHVCDSIQELLAKSDLVVTTTSSTSPIVNNCDVFGKKHIIAIGADDIHKQECEAVLFQKADLVIVDSLIQGCKFGDVFHAIKLGFLTIKNITELGNILQINKKLTAEFIITDLTGIAAQDITIVEFILKKL